MSLKNLNFIWEGQKTLWNKKRMLVTSIFTFFYNILAHYHTIPHFDALKIYSCGKHCEKGEMACNNQFLLFSQCFLPYMVLIFYFRYTLKCCLQYFQFGPV